MAVRVSFITLGCAKNLVDSERMLGILGEEGFILVGSDDPAEVMVINTCGFIAEARAEAAQVIEQALDMKASGQIQKVLVTGCLAQLWKDRVFREFGGVDAVVGLAQRDEIGQLVRRLLSDKKKSGRGAGLLQCQPFKDQVHNDQGRLRLTDASWSYLRISEGCYQGCSFCTIPRIRGSMRSKPVEMILEEARELVSDGAVELNLIGQETSSYGKDSGYEKGLAGLLRELGALDGLQWIRVLYLHPASVTEDLIQAIRDCDNVVPYIDLPLQHIHDDILSGMRRHITRAQTEELLTRLREQIENLVIRTTLLLGFPGEGQAQYEQLLEFVQSQRFDILGAFTYSPEEGTPAAKMKHQVPEEVKQKRLDRLMLTQQEIAFEKADQYVGKTVDCLLERELMDAERQELELPASGKWAQARHKGQAPETDGLCYIRLSDSFGQERPIRKVAITQRRDYDLIGKIIDD